jgi:hypothetical protein
VSHADLDALFPVRLSATAIRLNFRVLQSHHRLAWLASGVQFMICITVFTASELNLRLEISLNRSAVNPVPRCTS